MVQLHARQKGKEGHAVDLTESIIELEDKLKTLSEELGCGYDEIVKELASHMKQVHEYNEVKDIGQSLIGKLAEHLQIPIKTLYSEYNVKIDD